MCGALFGQPVKVCRRHLMPHLIETVASVEPYRRVLIHGWNLAALSFGRQRGLTSYFRKAWFRFEPWIIV